MGTQNKSDGGVFADLILKLADLILKRGRGYCYTKYKNGNRMSDTQCSGPHLPFLNFGVCGGSIVPDSNFC